MPAASEPTPLTDPPVSLPHRYRPLGVRIAATVLGTMLVAVVVAMWLAFPDDVRRQFTFFQRFTMAALGAGFFACGLALARSRIDASSAGVVIVNGYRSRRYEWTELLAVTLRPGNPWAVLDLSDGTSIPAMALQGSDGSRAQRQVKELRALMNHFSRTDRND